MTDLLTPIQAALDLAQTPLSLGESGALPSAFAVTDLAAASIGAAGQAIAELVRQQTARLPSLSVDRRLASFWFSSTIRPLGWQVPRCGTRSPVTTPAPTAGSACTPTLPITARPLNACWARSLTV